MPIVSYIPSFIFDDNQSKVELFFDELLNKDEVIDFSTNSKKTPDKKYTNIYIVNITLNTYSQEEKLFKDIENKIQQLILENNQKFITNLIYEEVKFSGIPEIITQELIMDKCKQLGAEVVSQIRKNKSSAFVKVKNEEQAKNIIEILNNTLWETTKTKINVELVRKTSHNIIQTTKLQSNKNQPQQKNLKVIDDQDKEDNVSSKSSNLRNFYNEQNYEEINTLLNTFINDVCVYLSKSNTNDKKKLPITNDQRNDQPIESNNNSESTEDQNQTNSNPNFEEKSTQENITDYYHDYTPDISEIPTAKILNILDGNQFSNQSDSQEDNDK